MSIADPIRTTDEILLSSDGHVAEPVDLWETRLPEKFRDRAPRFPNIKYGEHNHARLGGRDPEARLKDMAIDGVSAEVLYPTLATALLSYFAIERPCLRLKDRWRAATAVMPATAARPVDDLCGGAVPPHAAA